MKTPRWLERLIAAWTQDKASRPGTATPEAHAKFREQDEAHSLQIRTGGARYISDMQRHRESLKAPAVTKRSTEYAYVEIHLQEQFGLHTASKVVRRGTPGWKYPETALAMAREQLGTAATVVIMGVRPVHYLEVLPSAEQLLADMQEKLVHVAGRFADRALDEMSRDGLHNTLAEAIKTELGRQGIPLDFGTFVVESERIVQPRQTYEQGKEPQQEQPLCPSTPTASTKKTSSRSGSSTRRPSRTRKPRSKKRARKTGRRSRSR